MVVLRGNKSVKPRPRNRILVPLEVFFSNFLTSTPVLLIWEQPPPPPYWLEAGQVNPTFNSAEK